MNIYPCYHDKLENGSGVSYMQKSKSGTNLNEIAGQTNLNTNKVLIGNQSTSQLNPSSIFKKIEEHTNYTPNQKSINNIELVPNKIKDVNPISYNNPSKPYKVSGASSYISNVNPDSNVNNSRSSSKGDKSLIGNSIQSSNSTNMDSLRKNSSLNFNVGSGAN